MLSVDYVVVHVGDLSVGDIDVWRSCRSVKLSVGDLSVCDVDGRSRYRSVMLTVGGNVGL